MKNSIHKYGVFQHEFKWDAPKEQNIASGTLTSPSGKLIKVRSFRNKDDKWLVRLSPDHEGIWKWSMDNGVSEVSFECTAYTGSNPFYIHGPIKVSKNGGYLIYADGTPFFWLADTAWNGVIRGDNNNWKEYLEDRCKYNFNAIQYVSCQWRGDMFDEAGEQAYKQESPMIINPEFFSRIDQRVEMINRNGLLAVPVMLWSLRDNDVGNILSEEDAIELASYIEARYGAYQTVWLLGGDGQYDIRGVDSWKKIGREVFCMGHERLVTLHPCGVTWIADDFINEKWYDFIGYQSGHADSYEDIKWHQTVPGEFNSTSTTKPVINLEPNYETSYGYAHNTMFTDFHVRRAAYWSILTNNAAGVSYGHDAIWNWNFETGPSEGHDDWHNGKVPPWYTGLNSPGVLSMKIMTDIFANIDWMTLKPAQELLAEGKSEDPNNFVAAGINDSGTVFVYTPCGGEIVFSKNIKIPEIIKVIDPATGKEKEITSKNNAVVLEKNRDNIIIFNNGNSAIK